MKNLINVLAAIFMAAALLAIVEHVGPDYLSAKAISAIQFWIAAISLTMLASFAAIHANSRFPLVLIYLTGMILLAASIGNLFYHYDLSIFWQASLNVNGILAGLMMLRISFLLFRRPFCWHNLYKRNNRLIDEMEV